MENRPSLSIGQHSDTGLKKSNDDSYGVLVPDGPLLNTKGIAMAIADGVSGSESAKEASESCVKSFFTDYYCTHESWTVKTSVSRILTAVNRWLYGQGQSLQPFRGAMASTFSGMILKSTSAYIFHVGDSRIYRLRGGILEQLTHDHRMRVSRDQTYLGRAMGMDLNVEVDFRTVQVETGDMFIFTTDGIHDFLRDSEIVRLVAYDSGDLDQTARKIVEAAFENGSGDNLTCQIVRLDSLGEIDENAYYKQLQELPIPPELAPGMILDGYRILRELHASKRSQVYLAVDSQSNQQVVLKTPSANYEDDPAYLELFTREEWIGRRLESPHVLKVLEPTRSRHFLYYVAEYIEGQTLRQWMLDHPDPGLIEVRTIIEKIAAGLRAFHRMEMIHQDLKPENILIDEYSTVKIVDFGSTKVAGLEEISSPIVSGNILGTVDYSAPEYQLESVATNRSDIFSLGVICYEMLTGKLPYEQGFTSRRTVERLILVPANQHNPDIPIWVAGALAKAVHKDPLKRYDTLSQFIFDLSQPNPHFIKIKKQPLIERHPVGFWKGVAFILLIINFILLVQLSS